MPVITAIPGSTFALEAGALRYGYLPMRVRGMPAGGIVSAFRDLAEQTRIFLDRYVPLADSTYAGPYGDVRYWNGVRYVRISPKGTVAVPGTSTHTEGRALDMDTDHAAHAWMLANAAPHGWKRTLWDAHRLEPWHWEWHPSRVTITATEEDDMTPEQDKLLRDVLATAQAAAARAQRIEDDLTRKSTRSTRLSWLEARIGGSASETLTDELRTRATTATVQAQHQAVMARLDAMGAPAVDADALAAAVAATVMGELQALGQSIPEATVAELVATLTAGIKG